MGNKILNFERETARPSMQDLKNLLEQKTKEYNTRAFIEPDPVSIPHLFSKKQDIEIAGFFAAIFAWGNRTTIIRKSKELMARMGNEPHRFCMDHSQGDLKNLQGFCHRTFNDTDLLYCIEFFSQHYQEHSSLQPAFAGKSMSEEPDIEAALNRFHARFFSLPFVPPRTRRHVAAPSSGSTCKRLCMYLRWMVRSDGKGVDFGIWKKISPSQLVCPLDLHVARVSRKLGLLHRKQDDWRAALELTGNLRKLDPRDPVKYDLALFGMGVMEKYKECQGKI